MHRYTLEPEIEPDPKEKPSDVRVGTERWSSDTYTIQFGMLEYIETPDGHPEDNFHISAWGLSKSLHKLLADYSEAQLRQSALWLHREQNRLVVEILEEVGHEAYRQNRSIPPLDDLFITVDAEMFLPRGLRMVVTCVTNIVPHFNNGNVDKFVAIVDPGEAERYIAERQPPADEMLH